MLGQVRREFSGANYHAMNRCDRREAIFQQDGDRGFFLPTLGEVGPKNRRQVHAYGLMRDHFHLVLAHIPPPEQ